MIPAAWQGVRRVLAVRLDNLGDVLMTGPALRTLKSRLPHCHITLLASPGGAQAAALLPWVDEVIEHRAVWQELGQAPFERERELALVDRLAQGSYDAAIVFTSFSQTPHVAGYICYLAGIPIRLGASKEFGGAVLSRESGMGPEHDGMHQVDRNLALLEEEGFELAGRQLEVRVPKDAKDRLDNILSGLSRDPGAPLIAVAPWASCPARTYPPAAMAQAARALAVELGYQIALTGHERDRPQALELANELGDSCLNLVGELDFYAFAALIERARLLLCNNSAPMHLADATATPAVVLYAGTELESQWRPRHGPAKLLRRDTSCSPCYSLTCPFEGHPCLDIPVAEVVEAGRELLEEELAGAAAL